MLLNVYLVAGLLALAEASPAPLEKRTFKVERVQNAKFTGRNGPQALAKAYRKFGMDMPEDLAVAMQKGKAAAAAPALRKRRNHHPGIFDIDGILKKGGKKRPQPAVVAAPGQGNDNNGQLGQGNGNDNGNGQDIGNGQDNNGNGQGLGQGNGQGNNQGNNQGNGNGQGIDQGNGQGNNQGNGNGTANGTGNGQGNGQGNNQGIGQGQQGNGTANQGGQAQGQVGQVAADPEANDKEFLSPVKIGGQTVTLDFDTGSSDLWVFNAQLDQQITAGHKVYDPTKSNTFAPMKGASFSISYGDGSGAAGNVGTDVVDLGGAKFDKQAVELATDVSQEFVQDQNNDGLLGLGFSSINTVKPQKQKTFFDNVMPSLAEPVFTADLRKGAAGSYEFGKIDTAKFQGDMAWVPIDNSKGFWQFSSESFAVDGGQPQAGAKGGQAIADTGTTLILADPSIVQGYYSQVQGAQNNKQAGGVTVPCDAKMPDLDLDIGGQVMARIKGADLNFAPVSQNECFGGLQATQAGGLGVYGDIFFKSQFVAFNGGNNSIGVAPHA